MAYPPITSVNNRTGLSVSVSPLMFLRTASGDPTYQDHYIWDGNHLHMTSTDFGRITHHKYVLTSEAQLNSYRKNGVLVVVPPPDPELIVPEGL